MNHITPSHGVAPCRIAGATLYSNVLHEPIVGAFGLARGSAISVKGDPTLRETAMLRPRRESRLDRRMESVLAACEHLLRKTGIYAVYIGFNSSEIRTESIFNPFHCEIHDAEALISEGYLERHFIKLPYQKKMEAVRRLRGRVQQGRLRQYLPTHWRVLMDEERQAWQLLDKRRIATVMAGLARLRRVEDFYLRNAYVSLSQNLVRASFNCDGMYVVKADEFARFVEEAV